MSLVHTISVGREQYNVAEATAPKQLELIGLVGGNIALRQASSGLDIDERMLVGLLLSMSSEVLSKVSDIVLWKAVKRGGDQRVSVDHFQGNISAYLQLVAGGIRCNLVDFFDYLKNASEDAQESSEG